MATTTGAVPAIVLYFVVSRRLAARDGKDGRVDGGGCDQAKPCRPGMRRRVSRGLLRAPATWREAVGTILETLRFPYSETLGKWPIGDLAFGIKVSREEAEAAGYAQEGVLLQEPKAGDCLVRVPHSSGADFKDTSTSGENELILAWIKDTLTAATGAVVPFHHTVAREDSISSLVLGYVHCGMVAAALWIAKRTTPPLLKAVHQCPSYKIKEI